MIGTSVGKAEIEFEAKFREYEKALRDVEKKTEEAAKNSARALARIDSASRKAGAALKTAFGFLLSGAAAVAIGRLVSGSLQLAENLGDVADRANASVEGLQRLQFGADKTGSSAKELDFALTALTRRLGEFAQNGGGPAASALRELGLENEAARLVAQKSDETFLELADRIAQIESRGQQASIATRLLGDEVGKKLVDLLSRGSDGINELGDRAQRLGIVLGEDLVRAGQQANAELRVLQQQIGSQLAKGVLENADAIRALATQISESIPRLIEFGERLAGLFPKIFQTEAEQVAERIKDVAREIQETQRLIDNNRAQRDGFFGPVFGPSNERKIKEYQNDIVDLQRELDELLARYAELQAVSEDTPKSLGGEKPETSAAPQNILNTGLADDAIKAQLEGLTDVTAEQLSSIKALGREVAGVFSDEIGPAIEGALVNGLEDAILRGGSLRDILDGIVAAIVSVGINAAVGGVFQSIGASSIFGGARAFGGPVVPGREYTVGERGPERFRPMTPGVIEPINMAGGDTVNIYVTGENPQAELALAQLREMRDTSVERTARDIARAELEGLRR